MSNVGGKGPRVPSSHLVDKTPIPQNRILLRLQKHQILQLNLYHSVFDEYPGHLLVLSSPDVYGHILYVCMVTHISRVWINQVRLPVLLVASCKDKINVFLSPFAPENLVSRDGFGSPVPRQPAHLHAQAESGAYLRYSSRVPWRRPYIYLNHHTPSGQSRVYRVTQLRTDGVHCRESTGTGPVNLKVVPNGCCLGRSPWTNWYAPLFPTSAMGMKWAC